MKVKEIITELRKEGYSVKFRERTDGGIIITEINGIKYKGANGNREARNIVGVELSTAQKEQMSQNVEKLIKDVKKTPTLDKQTKAQLKKVQRKWKKNAVGGKAKITAKKVKWHIKNEGKTAADEYLMKMERYAEGYAYEENVEYLAQYIEDTANGVLTDDDLQRSLYDLADLIRSIKATFKEEFISRVYGIMYDVVKYLAANQTEEAKALVRSIFTILKKTY